MKICLRILPIMLFANYLLATVTGKVSDENGQPLFGANVLVEGTNMGAATNEDGSFSIDYDPSGEFSLVATYIGYKKMVVTTSDRENLVFNLKQDVFASEAIVVTGMASERSFGNTEVSVSRLDASELTETNAFSDVSQLLYGKVSGVDIRKSSGNVGGGFRFDVRAGGGLNGNEQPVIYVDGVRLDNEEYKNYYAGGQGFSTLADLNPEDIENIEVLKGPAAATTYGTNGSNGVVLITTKRGSKQNRADGKAYTLKYKNVTGTNDQSYDFSLDDGYYSWDELNKVHTPGTIEQHNLSVTGGTGGMNYYVALDDRYEEGLVLNKSQNYMDRQSARLNLDIAAAENLNISLTTNYVSSQRTIPQNDNNIFGWLGNTYWATAEYDENGEPLLNSADDNDGSGRPNGTQQYQPFNWLDSASIHDKIQYRSDSKRFIGSLSMKYRPFGDSDLAGGLLQNFSINGRIGIDDSHIKEDLNFKTPFPFIWPLGRKGLYLRQNQEMSYEFGFSYNYNFGPIQSRTSFTRQAFDLRYQGLGLEKQDFNTPAISNVGAGEQLNYGDEDFSHSRDGGSAFTEELSYNDEFFMTLSNRTDFASSIGVNASEISYNGYRLGWRADKTLSGFMPSFVSLLKPRMAYGESGVLPGLADNIALLWQASTGGIGSGASISNIGNPSIEPEKIAENEYGIDLELELPSNLGALRMEYTLYEQNAENSLVGRANSPSTGLTASDMPINVGEMKMSGNELLLKYSTDLGGLIGRPNLLTADITYSSSHSENEVIRLDDGQFEAQPIYDGFLMQVIQPGLPKYSWYNFGVTGAIFGDDGLYAGVQVDTVTQDMWNSDSTYLKRYAGATGVGSSYKKYLGLSAPSDLKFLSLNFNIMKNLKVYALVNWKSGHMMLNDTKRYGVFFGSNKTRNDLADQIGLSGADPLSGIDPLVDFDDEGNISGIKSGREQEYKDAANAFAKSDASYPSNYLSDASFTRLKEVSVSYNVRDLLQRFNLNVVNDVQVYYSIQNLWTKTDYSGADPEINWSGATSSERGQDFLTAMNPKVYTFGVTVTF